METNEITLTNDNLSWHSSEVLNTLTQNCTKAGGTVIEKQYAPTKDIKDASVVATIVLAISTNALYDLIKYAMLKICKNEPEKANITIIINSEKVDIHSIAKEEK